MRPLCLLLVGALGMSGCGQARPWLVECLTFETDTVVLTGTLQRLTFAGPPDFEDTLTGDEPETGFYLVSDSLLCTRGPWGTEAWEPLDSVRLVQLVLDSAGYERLRPDLGGATSLRGTLLPSHTGHHHAPLLLDVIAPR